MHRVPCPATINTVAVLPDRGRDGHYWLPPAQIRTCAIYA